MEASKEVRMRKRRWGKRRLLVLSKTESRQERAADTKRSASESDTGSHQDRLGLKECDVRGTAGRKRTA